MQSGRMREDHLGCVEGGEKDARGSPMGVEGGVKYERGPLGVVVEGVEKDERGPPGGVWKEVLLLQTSSSLLSAGLP